MASSEVWYTSDSHWHHRAMAERGWRPWPTVEEHDEALQTAWNETVKPGDIVFHLGDWGMGPGRGLDMLPKLHGTVHLITGNHDAPWSGNRDALKAQQPWLDAGFASIQAFARRRIAGRTVLLSHFPYAGDHLDTADRFNQYRLRDKDLPLLHGHVHDLWVFRGREMNVGVDVWGWKPVHTDTVARWVNTLAIAA